MGNICDMYGPRLGGCLAGTPSDCLQYCVCLLQLSSPPGTQAAAYQRCCAGFAAFLSFSALFVASMSLVENAAAYICMRLAIGFGLATFVANQYWTSAMFTPGIVGIANAVAGGWGNAGTLSALPLSHGTSACYSSISPLNSQALDALLACLSLHACTACSWQSHALCRQPLVRS